MQVKQLWDCIYMVQCQIDQWKLTLWDDIDTNVMEDQTKIFMKEIRAFSKFLKVSKAHIGIDNIINN